MFQLGIDVSKNTLDLCLLWNGVKGRVKTRKLTQIQIHACCIQNGCAAFTVAVINYRHSDGRNGYSSRDDFPLRDVCILLV